MDLRRTRQKAVRGGAAALVVVALAGCGSGDDDPAAARSSSPTSRAEDTDPQVDWADRMCTTVAETSTSLTPPTSGHDDVAATLEALGTMFDTMATGLDRQHAGLSEIGPPPDIGRRAFGIAMRNLLEARAVAHRVERSLSRAAASPPKTLDEALAATGGLQVDGADYPGFVLDLVGQNPDLLPAIAQAPSCADLTNS